MMMESHVSSLSPYFETPVTWQPVVRVTKSSPHFLTQQRKFAQTFPLLCGLRRFASRRRYSITSLLYTLKRVNLLISRRTKATVTLKPPRFRSRITHWHIMSTRVGRTAYIRSLPHHPSKVAGQCCSLFTLHTRSLSNFWHSISITVARLTLPHWSPHEEPRPANFL